MPSLELRTTEGVVLHVEVAGAASRFAAALLDALLYGFVLLTVALGLQVATGFDPVGASSFVQMLLLVAGPLVFALVQGFWQLTRGGTTPGKNLLGLRVVSEDGRPADLRAHLLRSLAWLVDCLPLPLPVGLMIAAAHPKRQRLGDLLAGTLVVRAVPVDAREPWDGQTWTDLDPKVLPLTLGSMSRLDGRDLALLRSLILRRGLEPDARTRIIRAVARHYAERLQLEPSGDPQRALREIYLCLREARRDTGGE